LEAGVLGTAIERHDNEDALTVQLSLLTGIPDITAQLGRIENGLKETPVTPSGSIAERFLGALRGRPVDPDDVRAFDRALILTADHELNAATFAARVAASTGADLASVVLAAIATQSGPLHGGAMLETGALLAATTDADPTPEIERRLASGQRIPGFGHSVYRQGDPRAVLFRQLVQGMAERSGDSRWLERSDRLARIGSDRTGLAPNLDLYAAAFWSALGVPIALFAAVFAIGRVAGWIAHYREQTIDNRLIRPRARYIGPVNQPYVPVSERGEWFTR
jgi:citrate synthase